jgi:hypothetical protein
VTPRLKKPWPHLTVYGFSKRLVKKKICIVGLISLFTWNALLGAFGGLLLCIHQDFDLHLDEDSACKSVCADAHQERRETESCLSVDESCVDIELVAEQLPVTRLKSNTAPTLSLAPLVAIKESVPAMVPTLTLVDQSRTPRGPPQPHWLTHVYLQTTVLRV